MKKDPTIFLKHILESITAIESYTNKTNKNSFLKDKKIQDATIRRLEIIGEAVKNLPKEFTKKYKSVPWKKIARMRDKLIHKYFGVDLDLTYDIIKRELPKLKKDIKKILQQTQES